MCIYKPLTTLDENDDGSNDFIIHLFYLLLDDYDILVVRFYSYQLLDL